MRQAAETGHGGKEEEVNGYLHSVDGYLHSGAFVVCYYFNNLRAWSRRSLLLHGSSNGRYRS